MKSRKLLVLLTIGLGHCLQLGAQEMTPVTVGEKTYQQYCAACHGAQMKNPQWGFDLGKFPRDSKIRFIDSVTYGKNAMPPWEDVLSKDQLEALWAYLQSVPASM
ncbi:c-type cytochrome [Polynucleobacter kasalickyi]|uniref:Cytochrome C oxidase, cbb3-type, subunit III n=1 Tax=Polynucleobacter kasalickyi TaxID=1938817 RepID=A0A1W1Z5P1_9BURK|nr:cytochrome c [Polynucleobacter kasalickyi]SMC43686.1 Cytochrome C oxidase, cbb3-type, subunit III [Polynucleobacter kasalickyi]